MFQHTHTEIYIAVGGTVGIQAQQLILFAERKFVYRPRVRHRIHNVVEVTAVQLDTIGAVPCKVVLQTAVTELPFVADTLAVHEVKFASFVYGQLVDVGVIVLFGRDLTQIIVGNVARSNIVKTLFVGVRHVVRYELQQLVYGYQFHILVEVVDKAIDVIHRTDRPSMRQHNGVTLYRSRIHLVGVDTLRNALDKTVVLVGFVLSRNTPQSFACGNKRLVVYPINAACAFDVHVTHAPHAALDAGVLGKVV